MDKVKSKIETVKATVQTAVDKVSEVVAEKPKDEAPPKPKVVIVVGRRSDLIQRP